jgi:hypothetical protein
MMNISWAPTLGAALVLSAAATPSASWSQSPAPIPAAAGAPNQANGTTNFQVVEPVVPDGANNPNEGTVKANLGDLLRRPEAVGLERIQVYGRIRQTSQGGASLGQIMWTSVNLEVDGSLKTQPLNTPLRSAFRMQGRQVSIGARIEAKGDMEALLAAARGLVDAHKKKDTEKDKAAKPAPPAVLPKTASGGGGGGNTNDVARGYQPPMVQSAPARTTKVPEREPVLSVTTNGCAPRVDVQAGFVVIQSQLLADGATKEGCSDTNERIPIQKSYSSCPDIVKGDVAQPQFQSFWVAPSGVTQYVGECQPDPETKWQIEVDTNACETGVDLSGPAWVTRGQRVYTNRNNQRVPLSPCEVVQSTPLKIERDYAACAVAIDKTRGVVEPGYKSWYLSPATQQQQYFTGCVADPARASAIQKDYASCSDKVGTDAATRQFVSFYLNAEGKRVDLGRCEEDLSSRFVIQTTFDGCSDLVDSAKGEAFAQSRKFYFNSEGAEVVVSSCAPGTSGALKIERDYGGCAVHVTEAGGFAQDQFKTFYMDRLGTRKEVQPCQRDPDRFYVLKRDYTNCADKRDIAARKAWAQFQVYYTNNAAENKIVNAECQTEDPPFTMNEDVGACSYLVDIQKMTAQQRAELYYIDRMNARVLVEACRPTASEALPVVYTADGCALRHDFSVSRSFQQKKYVYDRNGEVVSASACADSTEFFPHEIVQNVCSDLVLSDNSAVFKQVRRRITTLSGPAWISECEPSQEANGRTDVKTTTAGCASTFYHYIDAAQSFGAHRFSYQWSGEPPVYLTSCQQSPTVYPHKVEQQGWQYDDPAKSAKAKTAIYITPPIGRVDVSPAQVRPGAVAVAYVYVRSAETARPGSKYWVGCHAYQPTDRSDVYRRPDGTEVAYAIGAGTTAYVGDECAYTTENRSVYWYTSVLGSGYLFKADGLPYGPIWAGNHAGGPYTGGRGSDAGCPGEPISWSNIQSNESRTKVTYPNGGGVSYTAWSHYSTSAMSSGSAAGVLGYHCGAGG